MAVDVYSFPRRRESREKAETVATPKHWIPACVWMTIKRLQGYLFQIILARRPMPIIYCKSKFCCRASISLFATLLFIGLLSTSSSAADRDLTGKQWIDMDYGPYLTGSIQVSPGNIAYKGLAIRLDEGTGGVSAGNQFVLFDKDTLRYAAAWSGDEFIDWQSIVFDGSHGTHPSIRGNTVFSNPVGPGWGGPGDNRFTEERLRGHDKLPYGPLDRSWAHWKGLYRHGDSVVLCYTVGGTDIIETPGLEKHGDVTAFSRTIRLDPRKSDLVLQVAHDADAKIKLVGIDHPGSANKPIALLGRAVAATVGGPDGTKWLTTDDGHLRLLIPAGKSPARLKLLISQVASAKEAKPFAALVQASAQPTDPSALAGGNPTRWPERLKTEPSILGPKDGPLVVEVVTAPMDNPYRSWMRLGGFDFFKDNTKAAACTWMGDVWIVEGLGEKFGPFTWRRIASGMFQPLGLKIVDEKIYVTCRDQITRLHDFNGDGEIDYYENFNNDHQVTEHFHEFAMDLQTDAEGNFYYAKSARHAKDSLVPHHGTLIKVSKEGHKSEIVCNGFRAANGVGIGPNGELATSDQEGHWTPANRINLVKPGGFYGNMYSYHVGQRPTDYIPPLCWLPKGVDRSPAAALWVDSDRWGPLNGQMLSTSYGTGKVWAVMHEMVKGVVQGGVVQLPLPLFPTGIMRGRFHPEDGQFYACGLFGWSSNRTQPGGLYRVRYSGKPLDMPVGLKVTPVGIDITFSRPLDKKAASDIDNYAIEQWNYRWSGNYGSPHFSVLNPKKQGQDEVEVYEVTLSDDGKTVHIELEAVEPVMQMEISYTLTTADGRELRQTIYNTINVVPEE